MSQRLAAESYSSVRLGAALQQQPNPSNIVWLCSFLKNNFGFNRQNVT